MASQATIDLHAHAHGLGSDHELDAIRESHDTHDQELRYFDPGRVTSSDDVNRDPSLPLRFASVDQPRPAAFNPNESLPQEQLLDAAFTRHGDRS